MSQADGDVAVNPSEWLDNSDQWIAERVADAAAHQEEVMMPPVSASKWERIMGGGGKKKGGKNKGGKGNKGPDHRK